MWKEYAGDFNAMTDEEIENECENARNLIAEQEDWLEAVEAWKAAGKPRGFTHVYPVIPRVSGGE